MLTITIKGEEVFNEVTDEFGTIGDIHLHLEHSLASLSKWESKYEKPFLGGVEKTDDEIKDYIRIMILNQDPERDFVDEMGQEHLEEIREYIGSSQTATTFRSEGSRKSGEIITAEIVYYWMVSFQIPFECQYWHLNRLFALIRVCGEKNSPQKKYSRREIVNRNRELNAQRKAAMNTRG